MAMGAWCLWVRLAKDSFCVLICYYACSATLLSVILRLFSRHISSNDNRMDYQRVGPQATAAKLKRA